MCLRGLDEALRAVYLAQADRDPCRTAGYVFPVLSPALLQAGREADEAAGWTLMRDGTGLV